MGFIRKGIAKLGVLTMIATTICLAAVVLLVRLGDTVPGVMLTPFMRSYAGGEEIPNVFAEGATVLCAEECGQAGRDILRVFVEECEGANAKEKNTIAPRGFHADGIRAIDLKNAVKRTE